MKKKLLLTFISILCVLCCAFGLIACVDGDDTDSDDDKEPAVELTDAEWTAAFDAANYTNFTENVKNVSTDGDNVETSYSRNKFDKPNRRIEITDYELGGDGNEVVVYADMLAKIDGQYYDFYYSDGWRKTAMSSFTDDNFDAYLANHFGTMAMFGETKELYTFDNGVYSADTITVEPREDYFVEAKNVKFSFANGKIKTFCYEATNPQNADQKIKYEATFTDFGTTVINIPDVQGGGQSSGAMTEEEWFLNLAAFVTGKNFTLDRIVDGEFSAGMKLDGDIYYERYDDGEENYLVKDENDYFRYTTYGSGWSKYLSDEDEYDDYTSFAAKYIGGAVLAFGENYSAFEYSDGVYTAASIEVSSGFVLTDIQVTFNGTVLEEVVCTWDDELVEIYDIGTTELKLPTEFTDRTQPGTEVNIKEWMSALGEKLLFGNFTATMHYGDDEVYCLKVEPERRRYYYNDNSPSENYVTRPEDVACFKYTMKDGENIFTRTEKPISFYDEQLRALEPFFVVDLQKSYTEFDYDEKTESYVGQNVDLLGETFDIALKFLNGKLVYANIDFGGGEYLAIEYSDYDSTFVELPDKFVDGNDDNLPDFVGKTFVFDSAIAVSDEVNDSTLADINAKYEGSTISFGDGTFVLSAQFNGQTATSSGTYEVVDDHLLLHLLTMNNGNNEMNMEEEEMFQLLYFVDGGVKLAIGGVDLETPEGVYVYAYFVSQN